MTLLVMLGKISRLTGEMTGKVTSIDEVETSELKG